MNRTLSIIFVNGLAKDVTESDLFKELNEFAVFSIKIPKNQQTGEPFGYSFITFKSVNQAESALKLLNYRKLYKKTLRAYWFNRNSPSMAKNLEFNVFVKNLSKSITHAELDQKFSFYGKIISVKIQEDEDGESLGFGFILYDNLASVDLAIKELHETEWNGKRIHVCKYIKNKPKINKFNNVFVKNIPVDFSDEQITAYFAKYGEISSFVFKALQEPQICNFPEEKKKLICQSKFAFICFNKFEDAERVVNTVPYLSLKDEKHNDEMKVIVKILKDKQIAEKNLYKAALYLKENYEDHLSLLISSSNEFKLKSAIKSFNSLMLQTCDFYLSRNKLDKLQCFQALKKQERAKRAKEIFQKHKQSINETNLLSNLYIKNLNPEISESQIKEIFEKFGALKSFKLQKHKEIDRFSVFKTEAWLICFVSYAEEDNAKKAKRELNGSNVNAKPGLKLFVDYFEPKEQRQLTLKAKQMRFFYCANSFNNFKNNKNNNYNAQEKDLDNTDKEKQKKDSSFFQEKVKTQSRIFYERRKRGLGPVGLFNNNNPNAENANAKAEKDNYKDNEEVNLKNRLNFAIGNDFDFVFAKFRKLFGIVIDGESLQQANKAISEKTDFIQATSLNIDKGLAPQDNSRKNSFSAVTAKRPLTRKLNSCLLLGNKFDLNKENVNENIVTKPIENTNNTIYFAKNNDNNNNNGFVVNRFIQGFANSNFNSTIAADRSLENPIIENPFVNFKMGAQALPLQQQLPRVNLVNYTCFNDSRGAMPNTLIKQDPNLNNLVPLMMNFEQKFFTAPTQFNPKNSFEANFQANHLSHLFAEKLNSFSCFAKLENLFPKIIEKILIMQADYLQKMFFDDNYFISQVNLIVNFLFHSEKL